MNRQISLLCKDITDRLVAFCLIFSLSPLLITIALAIVIKLGSPILFTQSRCGFKGRKFKIIKFRTMRNTRGKDGSLLSDNQRLTPLGKFLRDLSLDELPELINVIKGDMSLVGPRPFIDKYLPLYTPEQMRRHNMKPGITGWAQINGRNAIEWEDKFKLDLWYIDNWSLILDLKILFMTVGKVLKRQGISQSNHATMREFTGTQSKSSK